MDCSLSFAGLGVKDVYPNARHLAYEQNGVMVLTPEGSHFIATRDAPRAGGKFEGALPRLMLSASEREELGGGGLISCTTAREIAGDIPMRYLDEGVADDRFLSYFKSQRVEARFAGLRERPVNAIFADTANGDKLII